MLRFAFLILATLWSITSNAKIEEAARIYQSGDKNKYPQLASELIDEKLFFSAIPFIKEYLATTHQVNDVLLDKLLDDLIGEVGIKQFDILPESILGKSNAPIIRYILARKAFRKGKYDLALKYIQKNIENRNPVKPYALQLEGSIYAVSKREEAAFQSFKDCIDVSEDHIRREKNVVRIRQLKINRDYCIVGIPRAQFSLGRFESAYSSYLDLEKSSYIWPEILFEEAWNSFYLKDYNRTLGKLVTYRAPVFNYVFNPEIEVLRALTYMEMCLWDDSKNTVENFYNKYEKEYDAFKGFLDSTGKDYKQFYSLVKDYSDGKVKRNEILKIALDSIARDPAYLELYSSYSQGLEEIDQVKKINNPRIATVLNENLKESLLMQRNLIGSYLRGQLQLYSAQMMKAFEDMSYIKLEILSKRKTELYENISFRGGNRSRGNVAHLRRTDKQYFWTFNGEFWADELGDYVFALKSECK